MHCLGSVAASGDPGKGFLVLQVPPPMPQRGRLCDFGGLLLAIGLSQGHEHSLNSQVPMSSDQLGSVPWYIYFASKKGKGLVDNLQCVYMFVYVWLFHPHL